METSSMNVPIDSKNSRGGWSIAAVGKPIDENSLYYKPKDDTEARLIEGTLAAQRANAGDRVFALTQYEGSAIGYGTSGYNEKVILSADNISAIDMKTGRILFTLKSADLGDRISVGNWLMRKDLNLPAPPNKIGL
jgi:hypothetical protein